MSGKKPSNCYPPNPLPPLILVYTGETCVAEGKVWKILEIQRASEHNVRYENKRKPKKVTKY
jgi:hypothetical protein